MKRVLYILGVLLVSLVLAVALEGLKALGALSPETAVRPEAVGIRKIGDAFSHSKKRKERVMETADGRVYVRIKE